jgi:prolyl oligopeptidase
MIPSLSLAAAIDYPDTRKMDVVEQLHGTPVADPYRWLEDDNSDETKAWVIAENRVTENFLSAIPQRDEIRKRLADLWNYERTGAPKEFGGRWFFTHNTGLQNQSVL